MATEAIAPTLAVQAARQVTMFVTPSGQHGQPSDAATGMSPAQGIAVAAPEDAAAMALTTGADNNNCAATSR